MIITLKIVVYECFGLINFYKIFLTYLEQQSNWGFFCITYDLHKLRRRIELWIELWKQGS